EGPDLAEQTDPGSGGMAEPVATTVPAPASTPAATAAPVAAKPVKPTSETAPAVGPGGATTAATPAPAAESDGSAAAPVAVGPQTPTSVDRKAEKGAVAMASRTVRSLEQKRGRHRAETRPTATRVVVPAQTPASVTPVR